MERSILRRILPKKINIRSILAHLMALDIEPFLE